MNFGDLDLASVWFLLVGVLYERRHTRDIADYGGLMKVMPVFTCCLPPVTLRNIGTD